MPNELCAAGGRGVVEAPPRRVSLKKPRLKGSRAAEAISAPGQSSAELPLMEGRLRTLQTVK